jgi:hypothetical protein
MEAYFNWMESLVPDFRTNAKNIFGMRGANYSLTPSKESGVETMFDYAGSTDDRRNLAASLLARPTDPGVCAHSGTTTL